MIKSWPFNTDLTAPVGSGDYPSLHSASGEGTMADGEPSSVADTGTVFSSNPIETKPTGVKRRTS